MQKLSATDVIDGFPAPLIRDALRHIHNYDSMPPAAPNSEHLAKALLDHGMAYRDPSGAFRLTDAGSSIAHQNFLPRMSLAAAQHRLDKFLHRCVDANRHAEFVYYVASVALFGSVLAADRADYGDIDLSVDLQMRPGASKDECGISVTELSGYRWENMDRRGSFLERVTFGRREVVLWIRRRDPKISITTPDDLQTIGAPSKIIFDQTTPLWEPPARFVVT